jgi:uncharacterized repeat protein (TIGR01451 family)
MTVHVNDNATGDLLNRICVSTTTFETNTNNNCDTETTTIVGTTTPTPTPTLPPPPSVTPTPPPGTPTPPPAPPDLTIVKLDTPDPVNAGGTLAYFISVTNAGQSTASAVVMVDQLPAGVTFISATPSMGSCNFVTCNLGSMAPGQVATITVLVRVNPGTTGTILNTACVSTSTPESNTANNCDDETTTIVPAPPTPSPSPTPPPGPTPTPGPPRTDLQIVKVDSPDPVDAGGKVTYGVTVTNMGPDTATDVSVNDALPAGVTLISATPSQGTCNGTSCSLGNIAAGDSVAIAFVVQVPATASGSITDTACVTSTTQDPNLANNCDDETTTIKTPGPAPTITPAALPIVSPPSGPLGLPTAGGGGMFGGSSWGSWLIILIGLLLIGGGSTVFLFGRRFGVRIRF